MKTAKLLTVFLICGLTYSVNAQVEERTQSLRFYEQLALRDATYEQELHKLEAQDELDYWVDQKNFERQLGKANFLAYLRYMKGKKEAYQSHLQTCNGSCAHSALYLERAQAYLSVTDSELLAWSDSDNGTRKLSTKQD